MQQTAPPWTEEPSNHRNACGSCWLKPDDFWIRWSHSGGAAPGAYFPSDLHRFCSGLCIPSTLRHRPPLPRSGKDAFVFFFCCSMMKQEWWPAPSAATTQRHFILCLVWAHMNHSNGACRLHCSEKSKGLGVFCLFCLVFFYLEKPFMLQRKEKDFLSEILHDHRGEKKRC